MKEGEEGEGEDTVSMLFKTIEGKKNPQAKRRINGEINEEMSC